ncbi:MAG TPA: ABC transporter transmembrane domain-containing protein, partial [bacterium]|nr:ABC transporter transmembrane domain-containing protein [bacterium]
MSTRQLFRAIRPFWQPYRGRLLAGVVFLMIASSLTMVQPWVIKLAIDDLENGRFRERIGIYIAVILVVTALVCICRFAMRLKIIGTSREFEHDLRRHVFTHIQILPKPFYDRVPTGDIMSRLTNDILRVRMVLGPAIMQIGNTLVSLILALIVMFTIDVRLTLLALLPLPLMPVMFYFMGRKIRYHSERVQEQMASITSCAQENLTGIRVVKAYNLESIESAKFKELSTDYVRRNLDLIRFQGLFMPLVVLLSGVSTTFILFFCGWWVIQEKITLGSMVAFIEYLVILSWPMFAIGWVVGLIQQASAAMRRIQKILNELPSEGMLKMSGMEEPSLDGSIEFRNVSFRYHRDQPYVLKDATFRIEKGESVALMGASGAGKSTIFSLLTRSYEPEQGMILINGHDIQTLPEYIIR